MNLDRLPKLILLTAVVAQVTITCGASRAEGRETSRRFPYQLTIYVDEGAAERFGHVFIELSNGQTRIVKGFYPRESKTSVPQALGLSGSRVADDTGHRWDVRRRYNIALTGYNNARRIIDDFAGGRRDWSINCYCGDFAEEVARAAGVPIQLPANKLDFDARPQLFGQYLREHGGELNAAECSACLKACSERWAGDRDDLFSSHLIACNNTCRTCSDFVLGR